MGKFHWRDGVFFERTEDGSVRVTKGGTFEADGDEVFVIDPNSWASIVCSVSVAGESNGRYYEAKRFHDDPPAQT